MEENARDNPGPDHQRSPPVSGRARPDSQPGRGYHYRGRGCPRASGARGHEHTQPDVVLFDISLSGIDGLQAIRLLKHNSPATTLLILTAKKNDVLICQALRAGARGSLAPDASVADLSRALQAVYRGELWVERQLMARFLEEEVGTRSGGQVHPLRSQRALTVREQEIPAFSRVRQDE